MDTINNSVRAFDLPAGATLTMRQAAPGSTALAALASSDGATGFTTAALTSSTAVTIGPFTANARINVMAQGTVSVDSSTGSSGSTTWAAITDKITAPIATDNTSVADAIAAVTPNAPLTVTAGFTFAKATHANRRIGYNSASAGNATFDGTAAFTLDDGFRLMQEGAGAVTLVASGVTFSNPNSLSLVTTAAGDWIDAEWDATIGELVITNVGSASGATLGANIFTGTQTVPAGSTSALGLKFSGVNFGLYEGGSQIRFVCNGVDSFSFENGMFRAQVLGYGLAVKEGANGRQGAAVLVAGAVTVSNTNITANSRILLTSNVDGGTPGFLRVSARTAGTSFTITSSSGTDTSTVAYQIFEPA